MAAQEVSDEEWEQIVKEVDRILADPKKAEAQANRGIEAWRRKRRNSKRFSESTGVS
jgi:hypothetical protein